MRSEGRDHVGCQRARAPRRVQGEQIQFRLQRKAADDKPEDQHMPRVKLRGFFIMNAISVLLPATMSLPDPPSSLPHNLCPRHV